MPFFIAEVNIGNRVPVPPLEISFKAPSEFVYNIWGLSDETENSRYELTSPVIAGDVRITF